MEGDGETSHAVRKCSRLQRGVLKLFIRFQAWKVIFPAINKQFYIFPAAIS